MHIVSSSSLCAAVFDVCAQCCCFGVALVELPCLVLKALTAQLSSEPSATNHARKRCRGKRRKTEENSERKGVIERPTKNGRCLFSMVRQNLRTAETRHSHNADAQEPVRACAAPSPPAASPLTAPLMASSTSSGGVSAARFFLGAGVFRTQVHSSCALPFWCPTFSTFRHAWQNGGSTTAVARVFVCPAVGVPCYECFQTGYGHGTTTTHVSHPPQREAWNKTSEGGRVGRSWHLHLDERRLTW